MAFIEVEGVTKRYRQKLALDRVSFKVSRGECYGILGHNGAGKTTLVETMVGLTRCNEGRVTLLGHNMAVRKRALFEDIGVQLQQSSYQGKIKVGEVCRERAALYSVPSDWRGLLAQFSLADKEGQAVESLSGGERQKLSVLLSIMHKPKLVFLDELTTGLDAVARREIWKYLLDLKAAGVSIILTSHYMDEVEALCDRILILREGKELAGGTVAEVVASTPYDTLEKAFLWYMGEENLI